MKNTVLGYGLALGAMSMCLAPVDAQQRFDQLAPEKTFVIMGAPDMGAMMNHIQNGPMGEIWNQPEVQDIVHDWMEQLHQAMNQAAEEMDVDPESFAWPTGSVGMAMFLAMNEDLGIELPAVLVSADFGDNMDKIEPLFEKALEKMRADGAIEDERDVLGRNVITFKGAPEPEVDPDDPWAQEMGGMENPMAAGFRQMHLARSENHLVLSSNLDALRDVFGKLDGEAGPSVADRDVFRGAMAQIEGNEMYMVVLTEGMGDVLANAGPMAMALPMAMGPLESLGFMNVKAVSMGMNFDRQGTLMAQSMGVYMPGGKAGLMKLFDVESGKGELPAFVGPDAVGYSRYNFRFSGLMDVVRQAIASAPEMLQQEAEPMMMQMGPMLEQLFNSLGPDIHIVTPPAEPQPAGGMNPMMGNPMASLASGMFAIRNSDPQALQNLLAGFAPQMGLQPRDFLGQTIFADQMGMFSIGLGGGYMFAGPAAAVEQALRATGQENLPSLNSEPNYRQAMGFLPKGNAVAWGYTDTGRQLKNAFQMMQAGPMGMMPMGPGMEMPPGMGEIPDLTPLAEYFGPGVWEMLSTDDGFVIHSYALPAARQN